MLLRKKWFQWKNCTLEITTGEESYVICSKLKEITTLRRLDLEDNNFSNRFANAAGKYLLDKNDHLEILSLKNNAIYSNGAIHIANGLSWNKCLTEFDLSENPLHLKTSK